ncbi:MAG: tetratricopeptide repeat protein [Candidatus Brocadiales bacterium]|nr:tetratricopeptide repeat protein [Candidatus Bathyanammoxibius amoris]
MSRILDQLKSARENKKAPLPNIDGASLDTVIEYNTPRKSRRPGLKRLIIILCASIGFILIAVFTALQLIAQNEHITPSGVSSAVQTTGQAGREVLAGSPSSKADWQKLASKELAAKKAETLPIEILSIESIDEGPVIEEIELGPAPPEIEAVELEIILVEEEAEKAPAKAIEIEDIELGPAPAAHLEIEVVELEIIPVEEEAEKAPAAVVEIETVEPKPTPAAPPETEVVELAPAPPKAVKPERVEPPRIEIKVKEAVVEGRAAEEATLVEAPPTVVMEEQEVSEALLVPVSPRLPPKVARAPRIEIKTTPQPVPAPEPTKPSPPVKVFEDTTVEIPPPAVAKAPTPPAVVPAPAQPEEEAVPEEEMVFPQKTLAKLEQFKRAVFYQKSGELKKARSQYLEIIKLDPMDPETHNNLGSIYQAWGDLDSAISEYRKALLIRPNYYKARNNLGVALYKQGNLQAALREFRIATDANPRDIQSLTNLGVISKKLEQPGRARQFFEKALSIDPSHAEAHYNLALILEENEPVNAIFHYQKFLEYSGGQYPTLEEQVMQHLNSLTRKPWG